MGTQKHTDYLTWAASRVRSVEQGIGEGNAFASIEDLYVDLPIGVGLTVQIEGGRPVRAGLTELRDERNAHLTTGNAIMALPAVELAAIVHGTVERCYGIRARSSWLRRPSILRSIRADGIHVNAVPVFVSDVIRRVSRAVLAGPAGSGKSTVVRWMVLDAVEGLSVPRKAAPRDPLPVLIYASELAKDMSAVVEMHTPDPRRLLDVFESHIRRTVPEHAQLVLTALRRGDVRLFVDGLDETELGFTAEKRDGARALTRHLLNVITATFKPRQVIATCRDTHLPLYSDLGLSPVSLVGLGPQSRKAVADAIAAVMSSNGGRPVDRDVVDGIVDCLPPGLSARPLYVALAVEVARSRTIDRCPVRTSECWGLVVDALLDRWNLRRVGARSLDDVIGLSTNEVIERVALVVDRAMENSTTAGHIEFEVADIERALSTGRRLVGRASVIRFLECDAGLLTTTLTGAVRVAHRELEDYLAGRHLVKLLSSGDIDSVVSRVAKSASRWRGPVLSATEELVRTGNTSIVWTTADAMLRLIDGEKGGARRSRIGDTVPLLARLLAILPLDRAKLYPGQREVLRLAILDIVESLNDSAVHDLKERAWLGKFLSALGDPREGVGVRSGVPDIKWCAIGGGSASIGLTETDVVKLRHQEWATGWDINGYLGAERVKVPAFRMSAVPCTQSQFDAFRRDGGYTRDELWTPSGKVWKSTAMQTTANNEWGSESSLPVTGVSWHEATAYCRWLSQQLGEEVFLPSDAQYQAASRGSDGRYFPWGDQFEAGCCNSGRSGIGEVCVVGLFPANNGPWGLSTPNDLAGNIWEWVTDVASQPSASAENVVDMGTMRVLKGGCYLNEPFCLTGFFQGRDVAGAKYGRHGFRVVARG